MSYEDYKALRAKEDQMLEYAERYEAEKAELEDQEPDEGYIDPHDPEDMKAHIECLYSYTLGLFEKATATIRMIETLSQLLVERLPDPEEDAEEIIDIINCVSSASYERLKLYEEYADETTKQLLIALDELN